MKHRSKKVLLLAIAGIFFMIIAFHAPVLAKLFQESLSIDLNFGQNGRVVTDIVADLRDIAKAMAFQRDGKIVIAGVAEEREAPPGGCEAGLGTVVQSNVFVARYTPDGAIDTSFGQDGKSTIDFSDDDIYIYDLAIQNDKKILVAGSRTPKGMYADRLIIRYHENGTLDDTFGDGGMVTLNSPNDINSVRKITLQRDNKILLVGRSSIVRLNPDGTRDENFGAAGAAGVSYPADGAINGVANSDVDALGRIVVSGTGEEGTDYELWRFYPNGLRDNFFGRLGAAPTQIPNRRCYPMDIEVLPNQKIAVGGWCEMEIPEEEIPEEIEPQFIDLFLARYDANGTLDRSFGSGGIVLADFGGLEIVTDIRSAPLGKLWVAVGVSLLTDISASDCILARYDADGILDPSFGQQGMVKLPFSGVDPVSKVYFNIYDDQLTQIMYSGDLFITGDNYYRDDSYGEGIFLEHYENVKTAAEGE